jgi:hypothetical protein
MDEQKSNPLLFPGKASHQILQRMPNTVIIEAEMDFYLTETTRLVIPTKSDIFRSSLLVNRTTTVEVGSGSMGIGSGNGRWEGR